MFRAQVNKPGPLTATAFNPLVGLCERVQCRQGLRRNHCVSPFDHREDITAVKPLDRTVKQGKQSTDVPSGAAITFRAVPTLTTEWLQHEINCHLARAAAVGFEMPEMSYCPLMLKGVKATVSSAGDGFAVTVESEDPATAKEVLSRAQALVAAK